MSSSTVRVGSAVLVAVAVSALSWPFYGGAAFVESMEILVPLGAIAAVLAEAIAGPRAPIATLRGRLTAVALLAAAQLGAALALFALRMFVSGMDAFFMALAAGYAVIVGLGAARLLARRALSDLGEISGALEAVGAGARGLELRVGGTEELNRLAREVETMAGKLAVEERARRELVAAVSHDLRTPITNLRLIAEGLADDIFEPQLAREKLGSMATHVRALSALIDDLFELSRLESGELQWSVEKVRLEELVHETIEAMRPQAQASRIAVLAELDERLTPASGNPEQLQRVLFNLIQNAIRHTPADGTVVVRAEPVDGRAVEVEVADTGGGIAPELRERIFEPFIQGPARVAGEVGSAGLGLAIARAIVEAHGGRIWVAPGAGGAHIRFSLPAA
ncbi:MAG TPA: HAMP domain-containing sensor histidine kinase [Solirubrobacteraceae bacterium]|nr:HAMP domain-containing sensor histidine kinase [Solirubrobacteraceae bacterium]